MSRRWAGSAARLKPATGRLLGRARSWRSAVAVVLALCLVVVLLAAAGNDGDRVASLRLGPGTAWFASPATGSVALVDGLSGDRLGRVRVAEDNERLEVVQSTTAALVVNRTRGTVIRVDGASLKTGPAQRLGSPEDGGLQVVASADAVWSLRRSGTLADQRDPARLETLGSPVGLGGAPSSVALTPSGWLWVDGPSERRSVRAGRTGSRSRPSSPAETVVAVGDRAVVVDPAAGSAHVVDHDSGRLGRQTCMDGASSDSLVSGSGARGRWVVAVAPSTGSVVLGDVDSGRCWRDEAGEDGQDRYGRAVESEGRVYVPDYRNQAVVVLDPTKEKGSVVEHVSLGVPAGHRFTLFAHDSLLWWDDPGADAAGVVTPGLVALAVSKTGSAKASVVPNADGGSGPGQGSGEVACRAVPDRPTVNQTVAFDATVRGPQPSRWAWSFPDGTPAAASGAHAESRWPTPGDRVAKVTATYSDRTEATATCTVGVGRPPSAPTTVPACLKPPCQPPPTTRPPCAKPPCAAPTTTGPNGTPPNGSSTTLAPNGTPPGGTQTTPGPGGTQTPGGTPPGGSLTTTTTTLPPGSQPTTTTTTGPVTPTGPTAAFTVSSNPASLDSDVTFTDTSTGSPTTWQWTFPSGTPPSSTAQNPVVRWSSPATYTIQLPVANARGDVNSTQQQVTVSPRAGRTLTVTKGGAGTGSVTSSPAGISCGSTCSSTFPDGAVVTLTAAPDSSMVFSGWGGGGSGCSGTGSCAVTLTADTTVTATFAAGSVTTTGADLQVGLMPVSQDAPADRVTSVGAIVRNLGPDLLPAGAAVLTLTLAGLTFSGGAPQGCTEAGATATCPLSAMPVNDFRSFTAFVIGTRPAGSHAVTATVSTTGQDPNAANNTATGSVTIVVSTDLATTLNGVPSNVGRGGSFTASATVANNGPSDLAAGEVTVDILPGSLLSIDSPPSGCSAISGGIRCPVAATASGASSTTPVFTVNSSASTQTSTQVPPTDTSVKAQVNSPAGQDTNATNDSDTRGMTVG